MIDTDDTDRDDEDRTAADVEAYEAELGAADAACCDVGGDCTVHGCEELAVAFFTGDLGAGDS